MPFDEEELDPHGECAAEINRLRGALASLYHWTSALSTEHLTDKEIDRYRSDVANAKSVLTQAEK